MSIYRTEVETQDISTHRFFIDRLEQEGVFVAFYKPKNPKNGKPWQASRYIEDDADVTRKNYSGPTAYSTLERVKAAVEQQKAKLLKGRKQTS